MQGRVRASKAKRKVILSGRRGGKTTLAASDAVESGFDGFRCLFAAPTQDQIEMFWDECISALWKPISDGYLYKNETKHLIVFPDELGGGRIRAKTAWNADTLRGDFADKLYLEEYALMDPEAWDKVAAPMLLDNNGDAWFLSTAKGRRNHFFNLYNKAYQDGERWEAFKFTSLDNPYLSQPALAEITSDMSDVAYRQEILAEFIEGEGVVFRNIEACLHDHKHQPGQHRGHFISVGVDWGKHNDYTAVSIFCADCAEELQHDRFNQIDYAFQVRRLHALAGRWHPNVILVETNAMGEPVFEQLQREGLPVQGFQTTATSKPPLIENLALAFEREEAKWIRDDVWTHELEAYERKVNAITQRSTYSAPSGMHDDTVMGRALAWKAATGSGPLFIEI